MAKDIVEQLKDLAQTIERGEGKSTIYGAADEIERLRYELTQANNQIKLLIAIETSGKDL